MSQFRRRQLLIAAGAPIRAAGEAALELLKEMLPEMSKVAVFTNQQTAAQLASLQGTARRPIPELALKARLPTEFHQAQWVETDGLMSYGFNSEDRPGARRQDPAVHAVTRRPGDRLNPPPKADNR